MSYTIYESAYLKQFNTFGVQAIAKYFVEIDNEEDLVELLQEKSAEKILILGGGSNILFREDFDGVVIKLNLLGRTITNEMDDFVLVEAKAGEDWHEFVEWAVKNNFGGVENLALIPGNVGTTPVQNIGAYGVEVKDTITSVAAINVKTGEHRVFTNSLCEFGYRDSVFKTAEKNQWIITSVTFRLQKNPQPNISYAALKNALDEAGITNPTIKDVMTTVINIRQSKLPDPEEVGNGGSFFKNPVIPKAHYEKIREFFPQAPGYEAGENLIKVPAAWLIETAGWKGYRRGDAGVHDKQALVLVNHGEATGAEIWALAQEIQAAVKTKFGIQLEPEINIF